MTDSGFTEPRRDPRDPRSPSGPRPRSIGERIKAARKALGLSQTDIARRVGVSQPAIANWESGVHDPRRLMLARLADALETPLDWLAAGDRSAVESDKHAAAAYIRRPVQHVPVISFRAAALLAQDPSADPHAMAEDYIPVTMGTLRLFAVFVNDEAMNLAFPPDTLVVIDYGDRRPEDGDYCLIRSVDGLVLRRWRRDHAAGYFEPVSTGAGFSVIPAEAAEVIGCARASIRVH